MILSVLSFCVLFYAENSFQYAEIMTKGGSRNPLTDVMKSPYKHSPLTRESLKTSPMTCKSFKTSPMTLGLTWFIQNS